MLESGSRLIFKNREREPGKKSAKKLLLIGYLFELVASKTTAGLFHTNRGCTQVLTNPFVLRARLTQRLDGGKRLGMPQSCNQCIRI